MFGNETSDPLSTSDMDSIESLEQIQKLVDQREPETERLEFKQLIDNKGAAKTIASMANLAGGIILFGVREEQSRAAEISPIELNGAAERIANIASDSIDEPLMLKSTTPVEVNGGLGILVVDVNPSERAPHFVNGQALIRSGPTTRPMSAHEIGSLFARRTSFTSEFRLESNLPANIIAKIERETRQRGMDHRGNFKSSTNYFLVLTNRGETDAFDVDFIFVNDEGREATFPQKLQNNSVKCLKGKAEIRLPLSVAMGGDHASEIRLSLERRAWGPTRGGALNRIPISFLQLQAKTLAGRLPSTNAARPPPGLKHDALKWPHPTP